MSKADGANRLHSLLVICLLLGGGRGGFSGFRMGLGHNRAPKSQFVNVHSIQLLRVLLASHLSVCKLPIAAGRTTVILCWHS